MARFPGCAFDLRRKPRRRFGDALAVELLPIRWVRSSQEGNAGRRLATPKGESSSARAGRRMPHPFASPDSALIALPASTIQSREKGVGGEPQSTRVRSIGRGHERCLAGVGGSAGASTTVGMSSATFIREGVASGDPGSTMLNWRPFESGGRHVSSGGGCRG